MILNPSKMHSGRDVRVRRNSGSHVHVQVALDEKVNRPYGAVYDVPVTNELGAFLAGLAAQAQYTLAPSLASGTHNYMQGTLHAYEDGGVVFQASVDDAPVWARPFFKGGEVRVGFSSDVVPSELAELF